MTLEDETNTQSQNIKNSLVTDYTVMWQHIPEEQETSPTLLQKTENSHDYAVCMKVSID